MLKIGSNFDGLSNMRAQYLAADSEMPKGQYGRSAALVIGVSDRMNQAYHEQMSLRESRLIGDMDMRHPQNLADALNRQERMHQLNIDIQFMMSLGQNARTLLDQLLRAQ